MKWEEMWGAISGEIRMEFEALALKEGYSSVMNRMDALRMRLITTHDPIEHGHRAEADKLRLEQEQGVRIQWNIRRSIRLNKRVHRRLEAFDEQIAALQYAVVESDELYALA